jgi:hypothetical protein
MRSVMIQFLCISKIKVDFVMLIGGQSGVTVTQNVCYAVLAFTDDMTSIKFFSLFSFWRHILWQPPVAT